MMSMLVKYVGPAKHLGGLVVYEVGAAYVAVAKKFKTTTEFRVWPVGDAGEYDVFGPVMFGKYFERL